MTQQLTGLFYIVLGAAALFVSGMTVLHLLTAILGFYFLFKGVALFNNHPHLFSQFYTLRSRFFDRF